MLGLLPSHLWAQPGHKGKECAGRGHPKWPPRGCERWLAGGCYLHLVGQGSPAWLWSRGHAQDCAWGLRSCELRVGCNGDLQPARVLHTGSPAAFGLTSLGKCLPLSGLTPQVLLLFHPFVAAPKMPWVVQSHGEGLGGMLQALGLLLHPKWRVEHCPPFYHVPIWLSHPNSPLLWPLDVKRWSWNGRTCPTASCLPSPSSCLLTTFHWIWVRCGVPRGALCDLGCGSCWYPCFYSSMDSYVHPWTFPRASLLPPRCPVTSCDP